MKGLEQTVFNVLLPSTALILCMVAVDNTSLSFILHLDSILDQEFLPHPSLFLVPTSTLPHAASFQITPPERCENELISQAAACSFPSQSSEIW